MTGVALSNNTTPPPTRRVAGERVIFWTLPFVAVVWIAAFLLFPGFRPPMSPQMSPEAVATFYREHTTSVRWSMILFNWFCVALIPILMLIVERMRGMAHRTPIMRYCVIGVAAAAPIVFLTSTVFWLLAAFRPDRAPDLTQLYNDLGWITFTCGIPFLVCLCLFLALAIFFDRQSTPVFPAWVARFNVLVAIALIPAGFAGLALSGPFAWNGFFGFWLKNIAIALWLIVMAVIVGRSVEEDHRLAEATA
jgi:hypothetical protein